MPIEGTYVPNAWKLAADQTELYERSGGTEGLLLQRKPCVILWTRGRKTGNVRKAPLMRIKRGDQYAIVASMGGAPAHPVWYLNLLADPNVSLQDGPDLRDYTARVATGDEKAAWWKAATEVWPAYDEYQTKTDREIPVVVLDPNV